MPAPLSVNYTQFIKLKSAAKPSTALKLSPSLPGAANTELALPGKSTGELHLTQSADALTLWVSLGQPEKIVTDTFRKAGGSVGKWLRTHSISQAWIDLDDESFTKAAGSGQAFLEGILLGSYVFNRYKEDKESTPSLKLQVVSVNRKQVDTLIQRIEIITQSVLLSREWAHEPANVINPVTLAKLAKKVAKHYNLKITILDENDLEKIGAGAILAVGKGSQTPARLIVLEYPGLPEKAGEKPVVLVGKALTFDTGGYSLKGTDNIVGMKYDKCGGITVLATLAAAASLSLPQPVVGVIGAAENMVSERAYRPDDILTTLNGKTVEIVSTDAEGRLVLADALTYAQQNYQPKAIIDLATLTGGVVVALGKIRAGLMSNDDALANTLFDFGERTAEKLWRLPLDDEYLQSTKGEDADLKNSGGRQGHAILGGIFLKQFVDDGIPWAHLDIAGVADSDKDLPYSARGATGFGVRLLIEYLQSL